MWTMLALLSFIAIVLAVRITERPVKMRWSVTESAANTFTEVEINLPVAIIGADKIQALELMAIVSNVEPPDSEDGQRNTVSCQLTRDSQSASLALTNDQVIWDRTINGDNSAINGSHIFELDKRDVIVNEEDGEIILERSIFMNVKGSGNAQTITSQGWLWVHIVELDGAEVATQLFVDDA